MIESKVLGSPAHLNFFPSLEFTGNWFVDAGIMGFVNLMEEVYGNIWIMEWKNTHSCDDYFDFLQILNKKFSEIPSTTYESLFSYAFWYKNIKETALRWIAKENFKKKILKTRYGLDAENLSKNIENKFLHQINKWNDENAKNIHRLTVEDTYQKIIELNNFVKSILRASYEKYRDSLRKIYGSNKNKKTIVDNLDTVGFVAYNSFFTNLGFFNPAANRNGKEKKVLILFSKFLNSYFVRKDKKIKTLPPDLVDKSLSPFVYSASDFNNQLYGMPMTLKHIESLFGINPAYYILCFPYSFIWIRGKYYMFYSPSIRISYVVNKELKYRVDHIKENKNLSVSIFKTTWDVILNKLNEYKAISSLENLYIVEYRDIQNQQIQDVEYIGISKLKASILLDDSLRESLNKSIPIPQKDENGRTIWIWILNDFIKGKAILPHIIGYTHGLIANIWSKNERNIGTSILITTLAVDAEIKEMKSGKVYGEALFDDTYFSKYREVVQDAKQKISYMYYYGKLLCDIIEERNEREKLATHLFGKVRSGDKYGFVNIILQHVVRKKSTKNLVGYIFDKILHNDVSWENYALALVIRLIKRGDEHG